MQQRMAQRRPMLPGVRVRLLSRPLAPTSAAQNLVVSLNFRWCPYNGHKSYLGIKRSIRKPSSKARGVRLNYRSGRQKLLLPLNLSQ